MKLKDKVAIITGGSRGIGYATAEKFLSEGAAVIICASSPASAGKAVGKLREKFPQSAIDGIWPRLDSMESVREAFSSVAEKFGRIDILVNNAGIADKHRPITECSDEWWDEVIAIDQNSIFYLTKEVLPYMLEAKAGSIVNVSSIGGVFGSAGISYSAAKSAVLGMTKNIAIQAAPHNIRCNAVCPGPTPTPLNAPEQIKTFTKWFADQCAEHMNMTLPEANVDDQANAILYFASDESAAVTGQVLVVDHGTTL